MPDVHVPHLGGDEDHGASDGPEWPDAPAGGTGATTPRTSGSSRSKSVFHLALEVVLISMGVFLGLMGEQWREHARNRELAESALRRFRAEIQSNRSRVAEIAGYRARVTRELDAYLKADTNARRNVTVSVQGIRPVKLEHSAWDVALATQSLAYIDADLTSRLANTYTDQHTIEGLTSGILQAMYLQPPSADLDRFLRMLSLYYGDMNVYEPALLASYDDLLPQIDRQLGEVPSEAPPEIPPGPSGR